MRSLRARLRRPDETNTGPLHEAPAGWSTGWVLPRCLDVAAQVSDSGGSGFRSHWNTLSTLGAGAVADVDAGGAVFPRGRPVAVDFWIGAGGRWLFPSQEASVRQTRVVGLPIVETRLRVGGDDIVWTSWAEEAGDGQARVVVSFTSELDVEVVLAVVVRPFAIGRSGRIESARLAGQRIVVDRLPLVELPRAPGDVIVGSASGGDISERLGTSLADESTIEVGDGSATLAAMIPLARHGEESLHIVDGSDPVTGRSDLAAVVAGWRTHVDIGHTLELPGWPKHLPASLVSGLLGRVPDATAPLGDSEWSASGDAMIATALAGIGIDWAAAALVHRLLAQVEDGTIPPQDWWSVATACGRLAALTNEREVFGRHDRSVALVVGALLESGAGAGQREELLSAVRFASGEVAASDAAAVKPRDDGDGVVAQLVGLARFGVELAREQWHDVALASENLARPLDAAGLGLNMVLSARTERAQADVVAVRALAGSTWRWPGGLDPSGEHTGAGDSPHARAALAIGLRAMAVRDERDEVDLAPGFSPDWAGRSVDVRDLPTASGRLSYSVRWHGERPALLWEMPEDGPTVVITCNTIDPAFSSTDRSGEALLAAPNTAGQR